MSRFSVRRILAPLLATALAGTLVAVLGHADAAPLPDRTFTASADAYVAESTPAVAPGTADRTNCFVNDDVGDRKQCLLTFTVTGLAAGDTVTAARILINDKGDAAGTKPVNVAKVSSTWSESTVTWANRPALGATVGSQSTHQFGADSEFRLAAGTITANGTYSFALWSPAGSYPAGMNFHTRDNTVGKPAPRLVLSVDRPAASRFPGDPGPGNMLMGLNDVAGYQNVQAHLPHPSGLHRVYNNDGWGVVTDEVATAIAAHQIPFVSWKVAPFTVSTVPQAKIDTACAQLKSFAPNPIWATIYHEPEENITSSAEATAYRALFRQIVHTCDAAGVTNVAWTEPTLQAPFTFGTGSGRNPAWWEPDWKGTSTGTAADWYTGAERVIDILSIDSYIPLIRTTTWQLLSTTFAVVKQRWTALGMPLAGRPWVIGEQGIKSDMAQLDRGPNAMQDAYNTTLANGFVGIIWWTSGGDSFCHGPMPSSDPSCRRELKLVDLYNDPHSVHP